MNKQPQFLEFSYETMCHTKVTPKEYEICIAVPQSKKYIGYITMVQEQPAVAVNEPNTNPFYPILIIYELNRFRKVSNIYAVSTVDYEMCEVVGWMEETIFYGSVVDSFFIMEDVLYYKKNSMRNAIFKEKLEVMSYILSLSDYFDWIPLSTPSPPTHSFIPPPSLQTSLQTSLQAPFQTPPPPPSAFPPLPSCPSSFERRDFMGKMKLVFPMFFENVEQTVINISEVPYPVHHIQYRSISLLTPILNVAVLRTGGLVFKPPPIVKEVENNTHQPSFNGRFPLNTSFSHPTSHPNTAPGKTTITTTNTTSTPSNKKRAGSTSPNSYSNHFGTVFNFNYSKPQYKKRTLFEVMADIQYDVYLLYAYNNLSITGTGGSSKTVEKNVYVNVAFISNYKTSKMMNRIFRKIKENENLDYIEESEDEEDFENADPEKFVDLKKKVIMEFQFNFKFKKWMPLGIVENTNSYTKIVPIGNL